METECVWAETGSVGVSAHDVGGEMGRGGAETECVVAQVRCSGGLIERVGAGLASWIEQTDRGGAVTRRWD